jgi:hypothetical protein
VSKRRDPQTLETLTSDTWGLSVPEAARRVGVSPSAMYQACATQEVESVRFCGRVLVLAVPLARRFGVDVAGVVAEAARRPK